MTRPAAEPPLAASTESPRRGDTPPGASAGSRWAHLLPQLVFFAGLASFYFLWARWLEDTAQRSADRPLVLCGWLAAAVTLSTLSARARARPWASFTTVSAAVASTLGAVFLPLGTQRSAVLAVCLAVLLVSALGWVDLHARSLRALCGRAALFFATSLVFSEGWLVRWQFDEAAVHSSEIVMALVLMPTSLLAALLTPRATSRFGRARARALLLVLLLISGFWTPGALGTLAVLLLLAPSSCTEAVGTKRAVPRFARDLRWEEWAACLIGIALLVLSAPPVALLVVSSAVALCHRRLLLPVLVAGGALLLLLVPARSLWVVLTELPWWLVLVLPLLVRPVHSRGAPGPPDPVGLLGALTRGARGAAKSLSGLGSAAAVAAGSAIFAPPAIAFLVPTAVLATSGYQRRARPWLYGLLFLAFASRLPPWRAEPFSAAHGNVPAALPGAFAAFPPWVTFIAVALAAALLARAMQRPRLRHVLLLLGVAAAALVLKPWSWRTLHEWPPVNLDRNAAEWRLPVPTTSADLGAGPWVVVLQGALAFAEDLPQDQPVATLQVLAGSGRRPVDEALIVAGVHVGDWAAQRDGLPAPRPSISIPARSTDTAYLMQRYRWRHTIKPFGVGEPSTEDGERLVGGDGGDGGGGRLGDEGWVVLRRLPELPNKTLLTIDKVWLRRPFLGERLE